MTYEVGSLVVEAHDTYVGIITAIDRDKVHLTRNDGKYGFIYTSSYQFLRTFTYLPPCPLWRLLWL